MIQRVAVLFPLCLGQALQQRRRNDVLDAIDVKVMQILARPHVAVGRVIADAQHLLMVLGRQNEAHGESGPQVNLRSSSSSSSRTKLHPTSHSPGPASE